MHIKRLGLLAAGLATLGLATVVWAAPTPAKYREKKLVASGKTYEYNIVYPLLDKTGAMKDLDAFINTELREVKNLDLYGKRDYKNKVKISYKTYKANQLTSVVLNIYHYTGGKKGFDYQRSFNYNWQNGTRLKYADVFESGKDFKPLAEKIYDQLSKQIAAKQGKELDYSAALWLGDATDPAKTGNFENFYFDGGQLVWVFDPGKVADSRYGALKASFSLSEIKDYLKPAVAALAGLR